MSLVVLAAASDSQLTTEGDAWLDVVLDAIEPELPQPQAAHFASAASLKLSPPDNLVNVRCPCGEIREFMGASTGLSHVTG